MVCLNAASEHFQETPMYLKTKGRILLVVCNILLNATEIFFPLLRILLPIFDSLAESMINLLSELFCSC